MVNGEWAIVNSKLSIIQLSIINYSAFLLNNYFYEATFLVGW